MKIRFQDLQESLRANIWARLERGDLTGRRLASDAGFRQAHLSNFLNGRRGLSLQAMDSLLDVLHLDVLDLANIEAAARHSGSVGNPRQGTQAVAVVSLATAARLPRFDADHIQDSVQFPMSLLRRLKQKTVGNRRDWTRFAAVKITEQEAAGMSPLLSPGAMVLLDRYYNAPPTEESGDSAIFAVLEGPRCVVRRVTAFSRTLILRSLQQGPDSPLRMMDVQPGRRPGDYIIGRVRHVSVET
jgi:hypothetical protein